MKAITLLISASFLMSCQTDIFPSENQTNTIQAYEDVDQRLWSYYESFEAEARKRGLTYDLNLLKITGEIQNIPETNVAGTCQYGSHLTHVTIDTDFWYRNSNVQREFVVFHELGHCVLMRGHLESSFNNGVCTSIMHSGLTNCNVAYNTNNRTYYLDELFSNN